MTVKIAIVIYSMYGHIAALAETEKKGILSSVPDAEVTIFQVPETLSDDILAKMGAPPKKEYPIITPEKLAKHDAFLFGLNTRFGNVYSNEVLFGQHWSFMDYWWLGR